MWQKTLSYCPFLSLKACNSCSVNCEPSWKISFNYPLFPRLRVETFGFCFYSFSCLLFILDFSLHVNHAFRLETSWCLFSSPVWHRDDAVPILFIYFFSFIYIFWRLITLQYCGISLPAHCLFKRRPSVFPRWLSTLNISYLCTQRSFQGRLMPVMIS